MNPNDQDLGGDDLKVVEWWVVSTSPGNERLVEVGHTAVKRAVTGATFGAARIGEVRGRGKIDADELDDIEVGFRVISRVPKRPEDSLKRLADEFLKFREAYDRSHSSGRD